MLWIATGIGVLSGLVGMNLSYDLNVQSGPTIVLTGAALFAIVFTFTGLRRFRLPPSSSDEPPSGLKLARPTPSAP